MARFSVFRPPGAREPSIAGLPLSQAMQSTSPLLLSNLATLRAQQLQDPALRAAIARDPELGRLFDLDVMDSPRSDPSELSRAGFQSPTGGGARGLIDSLLGVFRPQQAQLPPGVEVLGPGAQPGALGRDVSTTLPGQSFLQQLRGGSRFPTNVAAASVEDLQQPDLSSLSNFDPSSLPEGVTMRVDGRTGRPSFTFKRPTPRLTNDPTPEQLADAVQAIKDAGGDARVVGNRVVTIRQPPAAGTDLNTRAFASGLLGEFSSGARSLRQPGNHQLLARALELLGTGISANDVIGPDGEFSSDLYDQALIAGDISLGRRIERRQFGGPLRPGQTALVGEAGPELITPQQPINVIPDVIPGSSGSPSFGIPSTPFPAFRLPRPELPRDPRIPDPNPPDPRNRSPRGGSGPPIGGDDPRGVSVPVGGNINPINTSLQPLSRLGRLLLGEVPSQQGGRIASARVPIEAASRGQLDILPSFLRDPTAMAALRALNEAGARRAAATTPQERRSARRDVRRIKRQPRKAAQG